MRTLPVLLLVVLCAACSKPQVEEKKTDQPPVSPLVESVCTIDDAEISGRSLRLTHVTIRGGASALELYVTYERSEEDPAPIDACKGSTSLQTFRSGTLEMTLDRACPAPPEGANVRVSASTLQLGRSNTRCTIGPNVVSVLGGRRGI